MSTDRVYTVGQVLTAAQVNDLAQGLLNITATGVDQGPTSGTTEMDVITAAAVTVASNSRRIRISFVAQGFTGMTAGDVFWLRIKEGATTFATFTLTGTAATTHMGAIFTVTNPTAASHTYKVTIQRQTGTGVVTVIGNTGPIQILVEDMGAV